MEAAVGIEPTDIGFADRCVTTSPRRQKNGAEDGIRTRGPRLGKAMLYH